MVADIDRIEFVVNAIDDIKKHVEDNFNVDVCCVEAVESMLEMLDELCFQVSGTIETLQMELGAAQDYTSELCDQVAELEYELEELGNG